MASKLAFILLSIFSLSLFISSEVIARDLTESSSNHAEVETMKRGEVDDAKYGGYPGRGYPGDGGYGGGYPGYGGNGGRYPGLGGGGQWGGNCRYGCCGAQYGGGCRSCCPYPGEAVDAQQKAEPHN